MRIIYSKTNGRIVTVLPDSMDYKKMFSEFDDTFINDLDELMVDEFPLSNLEKYKVKNENVIKYDDIELDEIRQYGKVLHEDERLIIGLRPSQLEIQKAETTIEILSLLSEVL